MLAHIHELIIDLEVDRTVTLGVSMAGRVALGAGAWIGADAALAFSPLTFTLEEAIDRARNNLAASGFPLFARHEISQTDLRPFLERTPSDTRMRVVFCGNNGEDYRQARQLEGMANVRFSALPGLSGHNSLPPSICSWPIRTLP